jgi:hypothetical protein
MNRATEKDPTSPLTPLLLGAFFGFATIMCLIAGVSLLTPSGPLDWIWSVKPGEHAQLLRLGPWVGIGFLLLAIVMASASIGSFARRHWARGLAIGIFIVNALGDAARIPFGAAAEGISGLAVTGVLIWWLTRPRIRALFDR